MTACHKVFDIAELAEAIFLELPIRDQLCGVQQTCQQWKAIIDNSVQLQEALFFKPVAGPPIVFQKYRGAGEWYSEWLKPNPKCLNVAGATWRKSLVTQPPIANLYVYVSSSIILEHPDNYAIQASRDCWNATGLTLGDVLDFEPQSERQLANTHMFKRYVNASQLRGFKGSKSAKTPKRIRLGWKYHAVVDSADDDTDEEDDTDEGEDPDEDCYEVESGSEATEGDENEVASESEATEEEEDEVDSKGETTKEDEEEGAEVEIGEETGDESQDDGNDDANDDS
ncbi:uncharacterized protein LTR77_005423 [Saxophila tyrrhenica]|uniref:F-box domain-containing protein n=1 Tax=Saxophila tyrrhenica TaxID=1690608 RepID=A0AAV9PBJ4_9PEZI|nr:hypothetical protein LTR77_005423 [Saxophila tyrrhenica]